jgi:dihydrolipoamide dehydrogenase
MDRNNKNFYDIAIIGAGPAGYVAALEARKQGFSCVLIEKENNLGGTCLNCGCIPTKALLASAKNFVHVKKAAVFGVNISGEISFDYIVAKDRTDKVITRLNMGIASLLKNAKVEIKRGFAKFADKNTLVIENAENPIESESIKAKNIIIATGSVSRELTKIATDGQLIMNSKQALAAKDLPKSCLIIGGGAIGLEFASLYNTFGVKVTVAEFAETIIPFADKDVITATTLNLKKQGIEILTSCQAEATETKEENGRKIVAVTLHDAKGNTIIKEVERVVCAVGIVPMLENLGLENVPAVKTERGHIVTDCFGQTGEKNIFAIGDVASAPWLAHKASAEAIRCVKHIAGKAVNPVNLGLIPSCIYTNPQIAGFGLTEDTAKQKGYNIAVAKTFFVANGKALAEGESEGFTKIIKDKTNGEILGAWIIGEIASELISNLIPLPIEDKVFPHPTMSEITADTLSAMQE